MSRPLHFGSALSLLALSSMLAGCATSHEKLAGPSNFGTVDKNLGLATRALAALNSNDIPMAIDLAERAVAKTPTDAGYRALLGNAYFAGGRFRSAEAAYKDSLTLLSNQPQVVLKLALVQVALGKKSEALAFLEAGRGAIESADYGLAVALAGRPNEAIAVLQVAARATGADSRVRQNLALAYALAGDWTEARTIATQDVAANQVDQRIQEWMQFAAPKTASEQVASLVGVSPAAVDPGQPVRLALNSTQTRTADAAPAPVFAPVAEAPQQVAYAAAPAVSAPTATQFTAADPASVPEFSETFAPAPVKLAEQAPMKVAPTAAAAPSSIAAVADTLVAAAETARSAVVEMFKPAVAPKPIKARRAAAPVRVAAVRRGNSPAVMQIGAYRSLDRVSAAWNSAAHRYGFLKAYLPMSARFVNQNGIYYRLSVKGFGSTNEAKTVCEQLRRHGGSCFVRNFAGDAPVQYAAR